MSEETFLLRVMAKEDIVPVSELEKECFAHPYRLEDVTYELEENPCSKSFVAVNEKSGLIVGYIDYLVTFDSSTICRIAVKKEYRHQGLAQRLLDKMVSELKNEPEEVDFSTLEVRPSNTAALNLYKKNGYLQVTVKKAYYDDGEDAIYMVRSLI